MNEPTSPPVNDATQIAGDGIGPGWPCSTNRRPAVAGAPASATIQGMPLRVVLIGASGIFGSRVARQLAADPRFALLLAGRRQASLDALRAELPGDTTTAARLDVNETDFERRLAHLQPHLVIHAAGPFQGQRYRVAEACLACRSHYIDLADARAFVCGIDQLDRRARERDVLLASGASTLPAISGAIVDALLPRFARLDRIEHAISPGNRTPRGDATVAAILGYCGRPVPLWRDGRRQHGHGWMNSVNQAFPFGRRWTGLCDVPDLELFPRRYQPLREVVFRAGLELKFLHGATWVLAALVRAGLARNPARHAPRLRRVSEWFAGFGSDLGGMVVELAGIGLDGRSLALRHWLVADHGDGPFVPTTPAVVLARKLADVRLPQRGAGPCLGLFELHEAAAVWDNFDIRTGVETITG